MGKILDNNYYDMIINNFMVPNFGSGDDITLLNGYFSLLHVSKKNKDLCDLGVNPYHFFPSIYTLTSIIGRHNAPSLRFVQQVPDLNLSGQGTIIGIVDTGISYQHPAFLNRDKTTKIISIWDQTIQSGTSPQGFTFGTEYTRAAINNALSSSDPSLEVPTEDLIGHGTAVASIIAGSQSNEPPFQGIVPSAEIAVVKLKDAKQNLKMLYAIPDDRLCYQESDIILGIRYLVILAQKLKRPLVICLALGTSQGGHDGKGVLSRYIDDLVQIPEIGIVTSAGNEGNNGRHHFNSVVSLPYTRDFQLNVGQGETKFAMEIWPQTPGQLSIEVTSPNMEKVPQTDPSFSECTKYQFQQSESILWINNMTFEQQSGDQLILLRFENPLPGTWNIHLRSTENDRFSFHAWLPSGNLISESTFFLSPDPDTTITSPGNTRNAFTVTAYNQQTGNILNESSRGYTRSGLIKPEVASPGYSITCAVPNGQYATLTGTSASAAQAAGAMAILFEWTEGKGNFTSITGEQANKLLIRSAQRSPSYHYPNNIWGYGILDVYNLINRLYEFL
ncbi:MAG: peptidase and in kexin sedolisin [Lacrimispora sp.]|jgi:subtilisin family serine protease|nr:peptidase and in kexin sedolisin [Lacrimispora sp.]